MLIAKKIGFSDIFRGMELPPDPPQSMPHYVGYGAPTPGRPKSISVISVFAIVVGSISCLCGAGGLIIAAIALGSSGSGMLAQSVESQPAAMKAWDIVQPLVGLALGIVLLFGGVGGVQGRAWARRLLVKWSPVAIVFQIFNGILHLYFALTFTIPQMRQDQQIRGAAPGIITGVAVGQVVGIVGVVVLFCILPICILVYWKRPYVVGAFEARQPSY
jgi:hypothetical protein